MQKIVIGMVALTIFVPAVAHAETWYILDSPNDRCLLADQAAADNNFPAVGSPGAMEDALRADGKVPTISVQRDLSGKIIEADVTSDGVENYWFSTEAYCLKAKAQFDSEGTNVPPNELH